MTAIELGSNRSVYHDSSQVFAVIYGLRKDEKEGVTDKSPLSTQRTRVHTLQYAMPSFIHLLHPLSRRLAPSQEHHPLRPPLRRNIDDLLREPLPALLRMAIRFMRSDRKTRVQQQHAAVSPRGEQAAVVGRSFEKRVILFERFVYIFEGRGSGCWCTHGEAEAVGLVEVVIGVLADDDGFDSGEGSMSGPEDGQCTREAQ